MKRKIYLVPLIMQIVFVVNIGAQSSRNSRVEVIMPAGAPENEHFSPEVKKFTIYAISGMKKYKLKYMGHTYESEAEKLGYQARYEKRLPPGSYTLSIKGNEDYLLPGFQLAAGESYTINIPIARLPLSSYACFGGIFVYNEKEFTDRLPLRAEIFKTGGPFDISIHFCAAQRQNDTIVYKPARIYYKDYYIDADTIEIDRIERTITAFEPDFSKIIVLRNGVFVDAPGKTFSIKF